MKTPLLIILLLLLGGTFQFSGTAQDTPGQGQVDQLLTDLQAAASDPDSKFRAAWELSLIGPPAKKAIPILVKILVGSGEHPKARMSALNAVGHIGISEQNVVDQITHALRDSSKV